MNQERYDKRTIKEIAIDLLDIAHLNLLNVLIGLDTRDEYKRVSQESNNIDWIIGHCTGHLDFIMREFYKKPPMTSDEQMKYYAYNAPKELVLQPPPWKFGELVDLFIKCITEFTKLLEELPEENYRKCPEESPEHSLDETLFEIVQKIGYHILGHVGQITLIRREIGKAGPGFVTGIYPPYREKTREKWIDWWKNNKEKFY